MSWLTLPAEALRGRLRATLTEGRTVTVPLHELLGASSSDDVMLHAWNQALDDLWAEGCLTGTTVTAWAPWMADDGLLCDLLELAAQRDPQDTAGLFAAALAWTTLDHPTLSSLAYALNRAAGLGHLGLVRACLDRLPAGAALPPGADPLPDAAGHGHRAVVDLLLPWITDRWQRDHAMRMAMANRHLDIARDLLPTLTHVAEDDERLLWVALDSSQACVDLVAPWVGLPVIEKVAAQRLTNREWRSVDRLAPHAGPDQWQAWLAQAEAHGARLPDTQQRWLAHGRAEALAQQPVRPPLAGVRGRQRT